MKKYVNGILIFVLLSLAIISSFVGFEQVFNRTPAVELDSAVMLAVNHRGHSSSAVYIGNGYVLTSHHGLADGKTLTLTTESGVEIESDHLWSAESYDIALFRVDTELNINSYNLDCSPLYLHDSLIFVGNPLNLTHITVTGTVAGNPIYNLTERWSYLIPVQAPIIPGMSGGAVIDLRGNLRGINVGTMILNQGFAFSFTGVSYIVPGDVICMLLNR
jgi:serine protease DegQ